MPIVDSLGRKIYGPYFQKKEQRRIVNIIKEDGSKGSMSLARWTIEHQLGRKLTKHEEADHIDNNKLNDDPSNYQILTPKINRGKSAKKPEIYSFTCPMCGKDSSKPMRFVKHNRNQGKPGPFCGRNCGSKHGRLKYLGR
jgi:hypothetical protein